MKAYSGKFTLRLGLAACRAGDNPPFIFHFKGIAAGYDPPYKLTFNAIKNKVIVVITF
jgi:hypothetical protein